MSKRRSAFDGIAKTRQQKQEQRSRKERRTIRIEEGFVFEETHKAKLTDMKTLESSINEIFKMVFEDWHGCKFKFDQNGKLILLAYFKPIANPAEGSQVAFRKIPSRGEGNSLADVVMTFRETNRGRNFVIDPLAAELLSNYLTREVQNNVDYEKPEQFNSITIEVAEPVTGPIFQQSQGSALVELAGLDINAVLGLIFADVAEDGSKYIYDITCNRLKADATMYNQNNWLVTISQMSEKHFKEAMAVAGYDQTVSSMNITIA